MPTLLVIDDDPEVLYSVERSLRSPNLRVLSAPSAQEGVVQVRQQQPDAVILNVRLPDMSGLEAVELIHEIDARLPIVVITAFATTETAIEAIKRGAFEYLLKPVELQQLRDVVRHALIHASGDTFTPDLLPADLSNGPRETSPRSLDVGRLVQDLLRDGTPDVYRHVCLEVDRVVLEAALQHSRGNQVLASELLGISRNTLRAKLRSLGLVLQKQLLPESDRDAQTLPSESPRANGGGLS